MKLATFLRKDGSQAVGVVDTARGAILDLALVPARPLVPQRRDRPRRPTGDFLPCLHGVGEMLLEHQAIADLLRHRQR